MKNCPLCEKDLHAGYTRVAYPKTEKCGLAGKFSAIGLCPGCGGGFVDSELDDGDLEKYYQSGSFWKQSRAPAIRRGLLVPYLLARSRWKSVEPLLQGRPRGIRVLDIGAGYGFFGLAASQSRIAGLAEYVCSEPDPGIRAIAHEYWKKYGGKGRFSAVDGLGSVQPPFDLVVLSHVLEHVCDPLDLLKSAASRLDTGGIMLIDLPHEDYKFKKNVFPHILFFNPRSLSALIGREESLSLRAVYAFGASMHDSPLSRDQTVKTRLANLALRCGGLVLPTPLLSTLLTAWYGIKRKNNNGIWLRAVCQKKKGN